MSWRAFMVLANRCRRKGVATDLPSGQRPARTVARVGTGEARAGPHGMLPFSVAAALLVANISGNLIGQKLHWLGFAYAAAGGEILMGAQLREAGRRLSLVSGGRQGGRS